MNYKDPEVLEWVNEIRIDDGRKPLKRITYAKRDETGKVASPRCNSCPIGQSIVTYDVLTTFITPMGMSMRYKQSIPLAVTNWICDFDKKEED